MYVELEYLKFKNVLSYGAKEITHQVEPGLTMISGRNGTGKSTFLEVLCYNWYGKPYRKIKLEAMINRNNQKGMETETGIIIDKKDRYRILRGMKTKTQSYLKVFKNDTPFEMLSTRELNQDEITKILGIDYKMFKQIVSLAVTYNRPFLTQEAAEKREIVESIFNIKIFGAMLENLKKKISSEKVKYTVNKKTVEMLEESVGIMRKHIIDVKKSIKEFEENKAIDILSAEHTIESLNTTIRQATNAIGLGKDKLKVWEHKTSVLTSSIAEKEEELKKASTDVDNPAIATLMQEVTALEESIKKCEAEIIDWENTGVKDVKADYDADPEYAELSKRETEICTGGRAKLDAALAELTTGIPKTERLAQLKHSLDYFTKLINENQKTIQDENEYIEYLESHDVCQKCKAKITEEFQTQEIKKSQEKIATINETTGKLVINKAVTETNIDSINKLARDIENIDTELHSIQSAKKLRMAAVDKQCAKIMTDRQAEINHKIFTLKNENSSRQLAMTLKQNNITKLKTEKEQTIKKEIFDLKNEIERNKIKSENEQNFITSNETTIQKSKEQLTTEEKRKADITDRKPPFNLSTTEREFKEKISAFQEAYKENSVMADNLKVYDIAANMLSEEGIKSFFFKRLTPILNAKINEYLDKFEIPIRVKFNDQMEEDIYNVGDDSEVVSYYSYSEGEKKSIDTAILMSFIDITKVICNWNCNILMIDELIDGQVDAPRLEKMMECIREFSASGMIPSIYIISHRQIEEMLPYIKRTISINKVEGFSELTVKKI